MLVFVEFVRVGVTGGVLQGLLGGNRVRGAGVGFWANSRAACAHKGWSERAGGYDAAYDAPYLLHRLLPEADARMLHHLQKCIRYRVQIRAGVKGVLLPFAP